MKALLVDGLNLTRRIYAAVPDESDVPDESEANESESGESSGRESAEESATESKSPPDQPRQRARRQHLTKVIASCAASLQRALNQHSPSHCLVAFDRGGRTWRHQLFPDYKKNRPPMPAPLRDGLPQFEQAFGEIGVMCISKAGYEADDLIATVAVKIAKRCEQVGHGRVVILSTDRNYCQLLSPHIKVFDHFGQRDLDADMIVKRFEVTPQQLPDLLAMAGDSGLSIPGIKSIGIRTAAKLLADYGTLEKALNAADTIPGKLGSKLHRGGEDAHRAKTLFTLKTDIELGINLTQLRYHPPHASHHP